VSTSIVARDWLVVLGDSNGLVEGPSSKTLRRSVRDAAGGFALIRVRGIGDSRSVSDILR
jgi:hypothetical protein